MSKEELAALGQARTRNLDERDAARMLGCSVSLLRKWRRRREGPPYVRIGRLVRYQEERLLEFIEAHSTNCDAPAFGEVVQR